MLKEKITENKSFDERLKESTNIKKKYPSRFPIIVERYNKCKNINDIDKKKYLVPEDMTLGQFIFTIRKRLKLTPEKALFVFINNSLIPSNLLIKEIYDKNKNKDGFLYVQYTGENTFG